MMGQRRLRRLSQHLAPAAATATTTTTPTTTQTVTEGARVREALRLACPTSYARNAEGFPLLALGPGQFTEDHPTWLLAARSKGAYTWDVDGNRYIDCHGFGSNILGFSHDVVVRAAKEEMDTGMVHNAWYLTREKQERLAALIAEASPAVCEQVLFVSTGNDATALAMRAARAHTQRQRIAVMQGSYHGEHDYTAVSAGGLVAAQESIVRLTFNDPSSFDVIRAHASELAMVFVEGVPSSLPGTGHVAWLRALHDVCKECGVLFGVDETICGFRMAWGGAHVHYGLSPDLVTYGKLVGGGFPIGVLAGRRHIMSGFASKGGVMGVQGSHHGHPVTMATGCAVLEWLQEHRATFYTEMRARLASMAADLNEHCSSGGYECHFVSTDAWLDVYFQTPRVERAADLDPTRGKGRFMRDFNLHLLSNGVFIAGKVFLNASLVEEDYAHLLRALKASVDSMHTDGLV